MEEVDGEVFKDLKDVVKDKKISKLNMGRWDNSIVIWEMGAGGDVIL